MIASNDRSVSVANGIHEFLTGENIQNPAKKEADGQRATVSTTGTFWIGIFSWFSTLLHGFSLCMPRFYTCFERWQDVAGLSRSCFSRGDSGHQ